MSSYDSKLSQVILLIKDKVKSSIDEVETLESRTITLDEIKKLLREEFEAFKQKINQSNVGVTLDESHYESLEYSLCQRAVDVSDMNKTIFLSGGEIRPWLGSTNVKWLFWDKYRHSLAARGISKSVINEHERLLNSVLDMTGNPLQEGSWKPRKGLVMGNVQAGKTMNFIGLINKALDVGYHTIVVLGGHMDELRNQAQQRIDEGLPDTSELDDKDKALRPHCLTTIDRDFIGKEASAQAPNLSSSPNITVMKKHTKVMERFIDWISKRGADIFNKPFLLIDDEADYASINTKHAQNDYTSTNKTIRDMLSLFKKPTYIAYTATPFANVFIPFKQTISGIEDDDLFPSDFMLRMPIPDNYKGQDFFFPDRVDDGDLEEADPTRLIKCEETFSQDYGNSEGDWLPLKHKKDFPVQGLHPQLKEAISVFLIGIAIRCLRGAVNSHNTMLVNVTRFNDVQVTVTENILEHLVGIKEEVESFGALPLQMAISNSPAIRNLSDVYGKEFSTCEFKFAELLKVLVSQVHRVKVEMVNRHASNRRIKGLDYESYKDEGYWVIAVGGLKLSRGLTLEGLSVSFFLRNAAAYDTLTQMCRWFGYRDGYSDICRLYLLPQSLDHYTTVAQSIRELYEDLRLMQLSNSKPRDFGLKVRASETALLVTAKNKMGSGEKLAFNYRLWAEQYARIRTWRSEKRNNSNYELFTKVIKSVQERGIIQRSSEFGASKIYDDVRYDDIIDIVEQFDSPLSGKKNEPGPVISALKGLQREGFDLPKIVVYSRSSSSTNAKLSGLKGPNGEDQFKYSHNFEFCGQEVWKIARSFTEAYSAGGASYIFTSSSSIGDSDDLKNVFRKESLPKREKLLNDNIRKSELTSPVLMMYFISAVVKGENTLAHYENPTVMYILHFPNTLNGKVVAELDVSKHYLVNEILQSINSSNADDFDDEDFEDESV